MGSFSIWHWLLVIIVFMLLFGGRGKISDLMGDFAKGINSFKKGLAEDPTAPTTTVTQQIQPPVAPAPPVVHAPAPTPGEAPRP
ncbi:twin-arginine translocase TatA/TatE family subunit [Sphingosinicellaceae bacterium]|nr:twin-arginine translocase TatA/TatE family subunit [Sphingosinicellaceae bacterium]